MRKIGNRKNEMADINPMVSMITLSVDEFNKLIKRQRLSNWTKKKVIQLAAGYKRHTLDSKAGMD